MIHDNQIAYLRKQLFLPAHVLVNAANDDVSWGEISTLHHDAIVFNDGGMQVDGLIETLFRLPNDIDPSFPIGFRVVWTTDSTTAADGVTWLILAAKKALEAAITGAAAGALDTPIVADNPSGTAYTIQETARGVKNKNWFTVSQLLAGLYCELSIELDATDVDIDTGTGVESVWFLGLVMDYVPMLTRQPHAYTDAPLTDDLM